MVEDNPNLSPPKYKPGEEPDAEAILSKLNWLMVRMDMSMDRPGWGVVVAVVAAILVGILIGDYFSNG